MINIYKEISISLLSSLEKKGIVEEQNGAVIIGISTSSESTNTAYLGRQLLSFYKENEYETILINAVVDSNEKIIPDKINDSVLTFTSAKEKITYSSGKELVAGLKEHYQIILIALDKLTTSIPSLIFGSCCDGIVLFEAKDISTTIEIDKTMNTIKNIDVKPLGFVLG